VLDYRFARLALQKDSAEQSLACLIQHREALLLAGSRIARIAFKPVAWFFIRGSSAGYI
jgi:hypothetical protein